MRPMLKRQNNTFTWGKKKSRYEPNKEQKMLRIENRREITYMENRWLVFSIKIFIDKQLCLYNIYVLAL